MKPQIKTKNTPQRAELIRLLHGDKTHPSARELYQRARKKIPGISFATVYNNLEKLVSAGKLAEVLVESGKKRFDPDLSPHGHILCVRCRRIFDTKNALKKMKVKGFRLLTCSFSAKALCPDCLKKEKRKCRKTKKTRK